MTRNNDIKEALERAGFPVKANEHEIVIGDRPTLKMYFMGPKFETVGLDIPGSMSLMRADVGRFKSAARIRPSEQGDPETVVVKFERATVTFTRVFQTYDLNISFRWWEQ